MGCVSSKRQAEVVDAHQRADAGQVAGPQARNVVWPSPASLSPGMDTLPPYVAPDLRKDLLDVPWSKFPGRRINIWHFSDVRDLGEGPREPVGGAARMASAIHHAEAALGSAPLVLFSGGALGPSDAVVLARGEHAISALNAMQVQCAVVGNRDLAFGLERFEELSRLSAFPWLLSNARLAKGGGPVPGTERSRIIEHLGVRVGLIGLVDGHWAAPAGADDAVLECLDAVEEARVLASQLRQDGAEIVVALTHARAAVDRALCSQVPEVDLVLGGHDGSYEARPVPPHMTWMVKSGSQLRTASLLAAWVPQQARRARIECKRIDVTTHFAQDATVATLVRDGQAAADAHRTRVLGVTACDLDASPSSLGIRECPLANVVCDAWRAACRACRGADVALLPASALAMRDSRTTVPRGPITLGDVLNLLPPSEDTVVLGVTGSMLLQAIEASVGQWPHPHGGFLQVSGISFAFNGMRPAGRRVVQSTVLVGGAPLDLPRTYRVVTTARAARGEHGLHILAACPVLESASEAPSLTLAMVAMLLELQEASAGTKRVSQGADTSARGDEFRPEASVTAHPMGAAGDDMDSDGTVEEAVPRPATSQSVESGESSQLTPKSGAPPRAGASASMGRSGHAGGSRLSPSSRTHDDADGMLKTAAITDAPAGGQLLVSGSRPMTAWVDEFNMLGLAPVAEGRIDNVTRA